MKKVLRYLALYGSLSLAASAASAATCDFGTSGACELPSSNGTTQSGWTVSASGITGVKALDSIGPNGNEAGSRYFFGAIAEASGNATLAKGSIETTGDGLQVVGPFSTVASPGLPATVVSGGTLQSMLGNQAYVIYVQACPAGQVLDSALCSLWAQIGTKTTSAYPATVFTTPTKPGDATVSSINLRASVPAADASNISQISNLEIDDLTNSLSQSGITLSWVGNGVYTLDDSVYTTGSGFLPNTKYQYKGQVTYPAGVAVPTGGQQTEGPFWTTPVNPGTVTSASVTHCSAQITAQDSSPVDPSYTPFQVCATGTGGSCQTQGVGSGPVVVTITSLQPNTAYTPNATAMVGNGSDGTATGWNNSGTTNGSPFTTESWGTISIASVFNTSTTLDTSGIIGAVDITSYTVTTTPMVSGLPSQATQPPDPLNVTGLTPNTQYAVHITLVETSGCQSTMNVGNTTTLATVPQSFNIGSTNPVQATATWTTNGNSTATQYQIQYCTDSAFTQNCLTQTTGANATSATIASLTPETTYYAHVRALAAAGGVTSAYSNSASVVTPNQSPTLGVAVQVFQTSATLTATSTDNGSLSALVFQWTLNPAAGAALTSTSGTTVIGANAVNTTTLTFTVNGTYTGSISVFDHNDSGPNVLFASTTWSTSQATLVPTTVDPISPPGGTVVVGSSGQTFNATIRDQFGNPLTSNLSGVTWMLSNGAASNTPLGNSTFTFVTAVNSTLSPTTLTVKLPNNASQQVSITVLASGPQFTVNPAVTLNSDGKTASVSAAGIDNSPGASAMSYAWTLESGPAAISVSPNSSTDANNATVTFAAAGTYILRCTISDNFASAFAVTPSTTVVQVLKHLTVCPATGDCPPTITLQTLQNEQFTASPTDQFGNAIKPSNVQVQWNTSGGSLNASGASANFSGSTLGEGVQVEATGTDAFGNKQIGFITVTLVSFDVSGAYAYPVPYKANQGNGFIHFKGLGSQASIHIYTPSGRRVFDTEVSSPDGMYNWPITNSSGENLASGVYFYVIQSSGGKKDGKLIIIK